MTHPVHAPLDSWLRPGPDAATWRARAGYRLRTHLSRWALARLPWLARVHARVTVRDLFSTPGDTLLTATLCRHIKQRFPTLRLNVVTRHPALLTHDPHVAALNRKPGWLVIDFWYLDLQTGKDRHTNVLAPTIEHLGVGPLEYRSRVYLTAAELAAGRRRVAGLRPPLISINTLSRQPVKNWPRDRWMGLLPALATRGSLLHVGDHREPDLPVARRFAGILSLRESMAVVAACAVHVGPDSFLMHAANGLDVPSVIIFGGSRTPASLGYAANHNLFADLACSGCWLTGHAGDECPHGLSCQLAITAHAILEAADDLLSRGRRRSIVVEPAVRAATSSPSLESSAR